MSWRGRVWGGTFGFFFGGPLGALVGMTVGHRLDESLRQLFGLASDARSQAAFFAATFLLMGHLARLSGSVSESHIAAAWTVMERMNLSRPQRRVATRLFRAGKRPDFPFETFLAWLARELGDHQAWVRSYVEIQLEVARSGGQLNAVRRQRLRRVCEKLGFPLEEFDRLVESEAWLCRGRITVVEAYRVLGLPQQASLEEIRLAYRRLISRHHPDRLHGGSADAETLRRANERTGQIVAAYETLRASRKL
ncbi:MAG: co-chaperone DjlA [Candidatus Competibacteraceae bacterium]|nr:co-chaperone DjlA [Candidatus Competibacteraceae bacterium]